MESDNRFINYSSQIKKVFVELHDFTYFHSPSSSKEKDRRFIGREKLLKKLKDILTKSESLSGAYLITGYRGMGKTSFIGKLIEEITVPINKNKSINKFFTVVVLFLALIAVSSNLINFTIFIILLFVILLSFLKIKKEKYMKFWDRLKFFCICNDKLYKKRFNYFKYITTLFLLLSFYLILSFFFPDYSYLYLYAIGIVALINLIIYISDLIKYEKEKNILKILLNFLFKYIKHSQKIVININLGHDTINETEILIQIANKTKTQYENFIKSIRRSFFWRLPLLVVFVLFTIAIYNLNFVKGTLTNLQFKYNIYNTLPSQHPEMLNNAEIRKAIYKDNRVSYDKVSIAKILKCVSKNNIETCLKSTKGNTQTNKWIDLISDPIFFMDILFHGIVYSLTKGILVINYSYIFIFILLWSFYKLSFGVSHNRVLKKLKDLEYAIYFSQTTSKGAQIRSGTGLFNFLLNRTYSKPIAEINEIEKRLLEILDDIINAHSWGYRAEIIFVFDELDKIEPGPKLEENKIGKQNILFSPENTRIRSQMLFNIFSNLKYFLSSAKAKFIFIAGREMYDAALADVSDRDFFIRSIFHDVIYLESFLSDSSDNKPSDITSMTELYICQMLIPKEFIKKYINEAKYNLRWYSIYIDERIENKLKGKDNKYNRDYIRTKLMLEKEKTIHLLQQFITYMTHLSNGAPSRIKSIFESYVDKYPEEPEKMIIMGDNTNSYYLKFDYYRQYEIGVINYLISPFHLSISNSVRDYGDKLLISSSFLIDRLFKFHRTGFSWRYLELTPEVLDINKSPDLRDFFAKILNYLSNTHLEEIVSGLYTYKFPKRISKEIAFLSTISEEALAAFNFTLDETFEIKQYYNRQLTILRERYSNQYEDEKGTKFIHSIASVHATLGDLHYLSEEYGEAIIEYKESIQYLRNKNFTNLQPEHLVLLIRNMLKLGLAFEKKRTFDSAFLTYGQIADILLTYRDIDVDKINLTEKLQPLNIQNETCNNDNEKYRLLFKQKDEEASESIDESSFTKYLSDRYTKNSSSILYKLATYEGLKLIYQPLLAKFQILEKNSIGGITASDIHRIITEFKYLTRPFNMNEKYLLEADFWNKLGNILFYKNGTLEYIPNNTINRNSKNKNSSSEKDCKIIPDFPPFNKNNCKIKRENHKYLSSCTACRFYNKSLIVLLNNYLKLDLDKIKNNDAKKQIIELLSNIEKIKSKRVENYVTIANVLSDLGDVYYSCSQDIDKTILDKDILKNLDSFLNNTDNKFLNINEIDKYPQLLVTATYYYTAAIFFRKANYHKAQSFQLTKILYIIQSYTVKNNLNIDKIIIDKIKNIIVNRIIRGVYIAYNNIHITEIDKGKTIFNKREITDFRRDISLRNVSISSDFEVANLIFRKIKLNNYTKQDDIINQLTAEYDKLLISPYILNDSMYARILQLDYKGELNFKLMNEIIVKKNAFVEQVGVDFMCILKKVFIEKNSTYIKDTYTKISKLKYLDNSDFKKENSETDNNFTHKIEIIKKFIIHLITDSIFCYDSIIKHLGIFGNSFGFPHSLLGKMHYKLMYWSDLYKHYKIFFSLKDYSIFEEQKYYEIEMRIQEYKKLLKLEIKKNNYSLVRINKKIQEFVSIEKKNEIIEREDKFIENIKKLQLTPDNIDYELDNLKEELQSLIKKKIIFCKLKANNNTEITENVKITFIKDIEDTLKRLVWEENIIFFTASYQAGKAKKEMYSSLETHTEGKAYKEFVSNMAYLNDDYNDMNYHFSAARERYTNNSQKTKDILFEVKLKHYISRLFKHEYYVHNPTVSTTNTIDT